MLINLTNHPSSLWSQEQLTAAAEYGEVVDHPFPQVSPTSDEIDIKTSAKAIAADVLKTYSDNSLTIHLMGEFTMTVALLKEFTAHGIPCIASTTERIVTETEPGKKSVIFKFVRFRRYLL